MERNRSADQLRSSISSPDRMMPLRSMLQFRPERLLLKEPARLIQ
jgi:hypothetical protein